MIPDSARLTDYLQHVLQAIDRILSYSGGFGVAAFTCEASHNPEMKFPEFAAALRSADRDPGPC